MWFPDVPEPFVFTVTPDEDELRWATGVFPAWWQGTTISWRVDPHAETARTLLRLATRASSPTPTSSRSITPPWGTIIGGLTQYAETCRAEPFATNP